MIFPTNSINNPINNSTIAAINDDLAAFYLKSLRYNLRFNKLVKYIPISLINEHLRLTMDPKLRYTVKEINGLIRSYLSDNNYLPAILTNKLRFTKLDILYLFDVRKCKEGYLKLKQIAS